MQPGERGIIMLEDIPVQDESDASIRTRGRRTNRSSSSQLPKGSLGSTRRRASAGPATSLTRASEPRGLGQGGQESAVSAVDTLQAYGRGSVQAYGRGDSNADGEGESSMADTLQAYGRGDSNVGSDEESNGASGAVDLEPPPAKRTSTGVTTGFGGPAASPVAEGPGNATAREAIQMATDTSLAISRDSKAISGRGSNASSGGGSTPNKLTAGTSMLTAAEDPMRTAADGRMNLTPNRQSARAPMRSAAEDPMRTTADGQMDLTPDRDSNAISGGGSSAVDTQQAISRRRIRIGSSAAVRIGVPADRLLGVSPVLLVLKCWLLTSGPAVLEVRDPLARKTCRRAVMYDKYTRDAFIAIVCLTSVCNRLRLRACCNSAADRNRDCQRPTLRIRMFTSVITLLNILSTVLHPLLVGATKLQSLNLLK